MPIGYTKVNSTLYEIGPTIEEWEPVGTYNVTISSTSNTSTSKTSTISTNISNVYDYSRFRVKLRCTQAGIYTSTTSHATSNWWTWLTNSASSYTPICVMAFQKERTGTSGGTFDFSSYASTSTNPVETGWAEIYPIAPAGYIINQKTSGSNDYDQGDPGRCVVPAVKISTTTAPTTVENIVIDLNGNTRPLILRTWERGTNVPVSSTSAYSGTFSFSYQIIIEGIKYTT